MQNSSLKKSLLSALQRFSTSVAIQTKAASGWDEMTYADLRQRIELAISFLASEGFKRGDKIALISENRPEWGISLFACICLGIVVVPLDIHSPSAEIRNIINDSKPKAIILSREMAALHKELKDSSFVEKSILVDEIEGTERIIPDTEVYSEDLAVILYTSGTTSSPKGVMLTHQNLYANFYSLYRVNIMSSKDNILSLLPLYHAYSLMVTLILPILTGARIVYPAADWTERLADYVKDAGITMLVGVPQMFHMLHRRILQKMQGLSLLARLFISSLVSFSWQIRRRYRLNLARVLLAKIHATFGPQLRFFASGGARIDEEVERDLFKWGFTIIEGYGLTETSPVATFNPVDRPKIGSVGKPIPDVEIKIVDKDQSGIGEVIIQGPNVMKGYYHKKKESQECLRNGWFYSGDLGYFDDDGYLYLTGRSKELIVLSSGKNIYPEELETEYSDTPFVKEMCLLGISKHEGAKTQDSLHAVVLPDLDFFKTRGEMNIYDVIRSRFEDISRRLPGHKHITGFTIINEPLPRTVLGKLKRYEVERRYLANILKDRTAQRKEAISVEEEKLLNSEVGKKVVTYLKQTFSIKRDIYPDNSVEIDLGIDSLGRTELLCAFEKSFGIKLPEGTIAASIFTVRDLIHSIEKALVHKAEVIPVQSDIESVDIRELIKQPLSQEFVDKIVLRPGIFDWAFTFFMKGIIYIFLKFFYRLKIEGSENIPREGPYIICVNHVSFLDGFIVAASVPLRSSMRLFFIGFRRYFVVPVIRSMVKRGRILPIDATQIVDAMQAAHFILKNKGALCIFPEGERSFDGRTKRFKKGIGIIAQEAGVTFVPALIEGAFEVWPRTRRLPRLGRIKIRFSTPVDSRELLQQGRSRGIKDDAEAITSAVRERVIELRHCEAP